MSASIHVALLGAANSVHLQRWACGLAQRGLRVSVITQHADDALALSTDVQRHALPRCGAAGYFTNAPALRRLLRRLAPDLLHAHYASGYGTTAALAGFHPLVLSVWGSDVYEFPQRSRWARRWLVHNLRRADRVTSTSEAMAAEVRRVWPQANEIDVVPFGIDTARFLPAPRSPVPLAIGTVKTLAPAYGIDVLLRAAARLANGAAPQLLVVGGGPERDALQALAASLGIAERTRFVGAVPHADVPTWLQRLAVYVAPSRRESFGVAVLEASACGLPVVVSNVGGLPEVVEHGVTGYVVPADDDAALADALRRLCADEALRARMGAAGRARVLERYGWPASLDAMLRCYDRVLTAAGR